MTWDGFMAFNSGVLLGMLIILGYTIYLSITDRPGLLRYMKHGDPSGIPGYTPPPTPHTADEQLVIDYDAAFAEHFGSEREIVGRAEDEFLRAFPHIQQRLLVIYCLQITALHNHFLLSLAGHEHLNVNKIMLQQLGYIRQIWDRIITVLVAELKKQLPPSVNATLEPEDAFLTVHSSYQLDPLPICAAIHDGVVSLARPTGAQLPYSYNAAKKEASFYDTTMHGLLALSPELAIPKETRFTHMFVCAPAGAGKTTLLTSLIFKDFDAVARGEASIIIIDSTREFAENIVSLARFGPGGDLYGKLVHIDANDVEHPPAINLWGLADAQQGLSLRDQEALYNSTIGMLEYIFVALLGMELTIRQETLLRYTTTLMFAIPGATIDTMIEVLRPKGLTKYAQYVAQLDKPARDYLTHDFVEDGLVKETKNQVIARLQGIQSNPTIRRIFGAPQTRLDLFTEMGKGKVIVINAAKDILQQQGVELLTRYFLASILLAAEKRQAVDRSNRLPCYVYIDECSDVVRNDAKLPILLTQARKFNVGLILATQNIDNGHISAPIVDAILGGTAIKMAAKLSDANRHKIARDMGTTPEFLASLPDFHMGLYARGSIDQATSYAIPNVSFKGMPKMSEKDFDAVRKDMRDRYSYDPNKEKPAPPSVPNDNEEKPDPRAPKKQ